MILRPTGAGAPAKGTVAAIAAAVATALLVIAIPATPAWAHAKLLRTTPASGTTTTAPITTVSLTFNEPVRQRSTTVVVTGSDATSYSDGAAQVVDTTVNQAVRALPAGAITVTWKTVSPDGDPISGTFAFTVGPGAAPGAAPTTAAPPTPAPPTTEPAPPATAVPAPSTVAAAPSTSSTSVANSTSITPWIWAGTGVLALVLLAGGALYWRRRRA